MSAEHPSLVQGRSAVHELQKLVREGLEPEGLLIKPPTSEMPARLRRLYKTTIALAGGEFLLRNIQWSDRTLSVRLLWAHLLREVALEGRELFELEWLWPAHLLNVSICYRGLHHADPLCAAQAAAQRTLAVQAEALVEGAIGWQSRLPLTPHDARPGLRLRENPFAGQNPLVLPEGALAELSELLAVTVKSSDYIWAHWPRRSKKRKAGQVDGRTPKQVSLADFAPGICRMARGVAEMGQQLSSALRAVDASATSDAPSSTGKLWGKYDPTELIHRLREKQVPEPALELMEVLLQARGEPLAQTEAMDKAWGVRRKEQTLKNCQGDINRGLEELGIPLKVSLRGGKVQIVTAPN